MIGALAETIPLQAIRQIEPRPGKFLAQLRGAVCITRLVHGNQLN